jgi:mannose/fructose/N-acetylgalactosamine-specific phosphotransferase system component IIC
MFVELVLVSVFGGLVALDQTEAFQTMLSQPLMVGPVVGLLLNDLAGGLVMGVLLQLAYLWVMPIGTAVFPDPAVGAVVGSSGFIILRGSFPNNPNLILLFVLIFVVPFSLFAGWSLIKQRQFNSKLLMRADLYSERVPIKNFRSLFFLGLSGSFLRGFVITGLGILIVVFLLFPLVRLLSFIPDFYLEDVEIPVWGVGIGIMIYLFGGKKDMWWVIGGACVGIILILL